jgi:hypothetical protein
LHTVDPRRIIRPMNALSDALTAVIVLGATAGFALAFGEARGWSPRGVIARALHGAAALAALLALARFVVMAADWLPGGSTVTGHDFAIFYRAGEAVWASSPLYDLAALRRDSGEVVAYRHAPIGAVLVAPLTLLPYRAALHAWQLLSIALYAATLWSLLRHFGVNWSSPLALALAAIWAASTPSADSLALGQWDALFLHLFLILLTVLTVRRDRDLLGGAFLALPIMLKFFPALLLLAPLVARRWRIVLGCALGGLVLLAAGLLAGLENTLIFVRDVLPEVGGGTLYAENQTLYALVGRLLAPDLRDLGFGTTYPHTLTRALAWALAVPIVLLTALVAWRRGGGELGAALRFVLPLPAGLLLVPTAWLHYATLTLLPLAVLAVALHRLQAPWYAYALFALAALLLPLGSERDIWAEGRVYTGAYRLILSYKVYGYLALWAALCLVAWRIKPAPYAGPERRRNSLLFGRIAGS